MREAYKTLATDYEEMTNEELRVKRDELTQAVSRINKKYPGTDDEAFAKAQKNIKKYLFDKGESARVLNIEIDSENWYK